MRRRLWQPLLHARLALFLSTTLLLESCHCDTASSYASNPFKSIVFEGGGVKGAVYAGAIIALDEHGILSNVNKFAGTSAGSTVAALLAAGYESCDISSVTMEVSFGDLVEFPLFPRLKEALLGVGTISLGRTLKQRKGLFTGRKLEDTFDKLLGRKVCSMELKVPFNEITMDDFGSQGQNGGNIGRCSSFRRMTFEQLHKRTGKELAITGFDITNGTLVYFSRVTEPDMPVSKAVRISSSIPLVFEPVQWRGHLFMDGGVLRRIPVDAFDTGPSMLAMKIMPDYSGTSVEELESLPIKSFVQRLARAITKQTQDLDLVQRAKAKGVQFVDFSRLQSVRSVSGVDFHLSEVTKTRMWMAGYWEMRKMLNTRIPNVDHVHLPCLAEKDGEDCVSHESCPWAFRMLRRAVLRDEEGNIEGQRVWPQRGAVGLLALGVALVVSTSVLSVCRNGLHIIALQNYSGIRTQRCDQCFRMWVPSQLPTSQIEQLSLDEVRRALDARGIVVREDETKVNGSAKGSGEGRVRSGSFCSSRTYMHGALQKAVYFENISLRRPWTILSQSGFAPRLCCRDMPININLFLVLLASYVAYLAWLFAKAMSEDDHIPWLVKVWQG